MFTLMDKDPVIRFEHVGKRFALTTEKPRTILESFIALFSRAPQQPTEKAFWALKDVSFELLAGQCLGIVGRNGSGKSSMLKILTRILRPTTGDLMVRGRVSALLELGAGFHPDLSGRENIYLNASVLGISHEDIERYFADIVAFSELEEFIDMPVKHYSSGMYMRLGFSVAIHVRPDILIVDEILAVGDYAFQLKCLNRIYEMKENGVTIILVSHSLEMVRQLCTHILWLDHGVPKAFGPADEVSAMYEEFSYVKEGEMAPVHTETFARWGTKDIEITAVRLLNRDGQPQTVFHTGESLTVEMAYIAHKAILEPEFGLAIHRQTDKAHVNGPNNRLGGLKMGIVEGPGIVRYHIEQVPLLPAHYLLTTAVHDSRQPIAYDYHDQAYPFQMIPGSNRELYGLVEIPATWSWEPASPSRTNPQAVAPSLVV